MAYTFGNIDNPLVKINPNGYGDLTSTSGNGGLVMFISNAVKLITVAAGLFAFFNIIIAGFTYITSGSDAKKTTEAWSRIYMSLIGLIVIVASFAISAILGKLLFNDFNAILSPSIYGPGQ